MGGGEEGVCFDPGFYGLAVSWVVWARAGALYWLECAP